MPAFAASIAVRMRLLTVSVSMSSGTASSATPLAVDGLLAVVDQHLAAANGEGLSFSGLRHPARVFVADLAKLADDRQPLAEVFRQQSLQHRRIERRVGRSEQAAKTQQGTGDQTAHVLVH